MKQRAEAQSGQQFDAVLSGRPVHFHSDDPARDCRAQDDLRACYHAAGFERVSFLFEPEAAALASHGADRLGEIGLIVDIGGGTSDFSVFRATGAGVSVLASHGVRIGGTDRPSPGKALVSMNSMPTTDAESAIVSVWLPGTGTSTTSDADSA